MQIDQETLNSLFKELVALDTLNQKDPEELIDQYEYYEMAEKKFIKMFNNKQISSENEVKLIHRFIARLSEAYQVLQAKKSIHRSKASTFQPTIYGCLSNMYDGKQGVFVQLITSIFVECRLQIEIANRKLTNNDIVKRIHSQDEEDEKPPSISQLILQKRNTQPEWQTNINNNKNLSQYFKKEHAKIYDLLGIDKYQEDQFLYFQSREQNMDRLFQQLMAQNVHIKKSLSWAADLDLSEFHEQVKCIVTSFTPMQIIKTDQFDGQKTVSSFFSPNEQQFKIRSYSQNAKTKDIYSFSEKINIFHPNYQEQIKYKMSKSKIEQRTKKPPIANILTRKALFDPQNAKKKTKSFRFKN